MHICLRCFLLSALQRSQGHSLLLTPWKNPFNFWHGKKGSRAERTGMRYGACDIEKRDQGWSPFPLPGTTFSRKGVVLV